MYTVDDIIQYLEQHDDIFIDAIEELDSWDGYLNGERYMEMDFFNDYHYGLTPLEIADRAVNGKDEGWSDSFSVGREYFYYDDLGQLISADEKDYSDKLDKWFVEDLYNERRNLHLSDALLAFMLENCEVDEDA